MPNPTTVLPIGLAWACGAVMLLGLYGLVRGIGRAIRLYNPEGNTFTLPAQQGEFRFPLSAAGMYEVACTRPGSWGNPFTLPTTTLRLRRLPDGTVQALQPSFWQSARRTDLSGNTTQRIADFVADAPGEYELLNPGADLFRPGDQLRIQPSTAGKTLPLILLLLVSGLATIGGFVVGLIAVVDASR